MAEDKFDPEAPEHKALLDKFFNDHRHIVANHISGLMAQNRLDPKIDPRMLDHHGNIALAESLMRFKPKEGATEHTIGHYAKKVVEGKIMEYMKSQGGIDKLFHQHAKIPGHVANLQRLLADKQAKIQSQSTVPTPSAPALPLPVPGSPKPKI